MSGRFDRTLFIDSGVCGCVKSVGASVVFSHAFSGELKAVSVVNEAIQNGVAEGGIAYDVVPVFHGDLAGDDGRSAAMAIIEDFQKIAALGGTENRQAPVVEDEELNAPERLEQAAIASVAARQRERLEQTRDAMIEHRSIVAAGFVAERAGKPTLAQAGCACDQHVLMAVDPVAADEPGEDGAVDAARGAQIDILHACALAQRGEFEPRREPFCVALGGFAVDKKTDALLERQGLKVRRSSLFLEGFGHSGQAECNQPFMG